MLRLGSRARYQGHDCIVVGRTIEAHPRYDLLFPVSRRIEQNVLEKDLESCFIAPLTSADCAIRADVIIQHSSRLREDRAS
jgi:hypothetical protein